jgi:hypothetical protein
MRHDERLPRSLLEMNRYLANPASIKPLDPRHDIPPLTASMRNRERKVLANSWDAGEQNHEAVLPSGSNEVHLNANRCVTRFVHLEPPLLRKEDAADAQPEAARW